MNYGSDLADQVVRYSLEGAEAALKLSGGHGLSRNFCIQNDWFSSQKTPIVFY